MEFNSDFIVLDIATKNTGYLVIKNLMIVDMGVIKSETLNFSWIPVGEGRTDKELYTKKRKTGKTVKKRDTKLREDKLHNRLVHQHNELKKILTEHEPRYIVKEMPVMVMHSKMYDNRTGIDLGQSHGIINVLDIPIITYYPIQWRNAIKKHIKKCAILEPIIEKENRKHYQKITREVNKKPFVDFFIFQNGFLPETNDISDCYAMYYYHTNLDKSMFSYDRLKEYWDLWLDYYNYNYDGKIMY